MVAMGKILKLITGLRMRLEAKNTERKLFVTILNAKVVEGSIGGQERAIRASRISHLKRVEIGSANR